MLSRKTTARNKGLLTLAGIAGLVLATASPAFAAQVISGAGVGTGWDFPSGANPPIDCLGAPLIGSIAGDQIVLTDTGTYTGTNPAGVSVAVFTGETRVTINIGPHVISPAGVSPTCLPHPAPVPIVSVTVRDTATNGGLVSCNSTASPANLYTRVSSAVNFTFQSDCTIVGNTLNIGTTVHANPTFHTISGTMNPCDVPPFFDNENPECNPPVATRPNGSGSHLVVTYSAAGVLPTVP